MSYFVSYLDLPYLDSGISIQCGLNKKKVSIYQNKLNFSIRLDWSKIFTVLRAI